MLFLTVHNILIWNLILIFFQGDLDIWMEYINFCKKNVRLYLLLYFFLYFNCEKWNEFSRWKNTIWTITVRLFKSKTSKNQLRPFLWINDIYFYSRKRKEPYQKYFQKCFKNIHIMQVHILQYISFLLKQLVNV